MRTRFPHQALTPAGAVACLTLTFISISAWWVSVDKSIPDGDSGKHINYALNYFDAVRAGHPLSLLLTWTEYPPLAHAVGALGAAVGGVAIASVVMAGNLVFVPLLAIGCYGAGKEVAGPRAGALAALFALSAPMVIGLFHVFMLDPPEAAAAAVAVWLLLASRRFKSTPYTIAAGIAVAAGFYVKATFVLFVAGLIAMLLIRGGWRNWRGFLTFAAVALILIEPWYFVHFNDLRAETRGAAVAQLASCAPYRCPPRWSFDNFTWYGWDLLNVQLYLPLTLFFIGGLAASGLLIARRRAGATYLPELIVGGLVGYVGISWLTLDDPRYSLPGLVYVAVLGTAWIVRLPRLLPAVAAVALVAIFALNTTMVSFGKGPSTELTLYRPKTRDVAGYVTVVRPVGYTVAGPLRSDVRPKFIRLLKDARVAGARNVIFQPESLNSRGFNLFALTVFARIADLGVPGFSVNLVGPDDIYVFRLSRAHAPRPCLALANRTGIYMTKGPPSPGNKLYCPPQRAQ